ncbi:MFS transporter [Spirochaetia bacterium]|nr:MFS transporter [Spirochaetia bacterium]
MYWGFLFGVLFLMYGAAGPYLSILLRSLGFSHSYVGILTALCEGAAILSPFVFGQFADRCGRYKPIIIFTFLVSALSAAFILLKPPLLLCSISLIFLSFAYRGAQPLVEAVCTINMGKNGNYGKYRVVGSLTYFLIVVFLQFTPVLRPNTAANISLWTMICAGIGMVFVLFSPSYLLTNIKKEKRGTDIAKSDEDANKIHNLSGDNIRGAHKENLWTPVLVLGIILVFLSRLAMAPINSFVPLYVVEYLEWDAIGLMFALSSGSEMPFILISKKLIKRFGDLQLIAAGTIAVILRLLICAIFPYKGGIVVSQCLHSLSYGVFHPAAISFITRNVPPDKRALGMSLYFALGTGVPTLIGNAGVGFIVEYFGYRVMFASFSLPAIAALVLYFVYAHKKA